MSAASAWVDGRTVPAGAAALPATDLGLRLGLGVFETFRIEARRVAGLDAHLDRLVAGGDRLGVAVDVAAVRAGLGALLAESGDGAVVARVTVTAGDAAPGWPPEPAGRPRTLVTLHPAPALPTPDVDAVVVPGPRAPLGLADVKSIAYTGSVMATRAARLRGAEVALLAEDGEVREAADGNLLVLRGDVLRTPPADGRILPGVTRTLVIGLATGMGLQVEEAALGAPDLEAADLVVVSSAVRRLRRVRSVDGRRVGGAADRAGASDRLLSALRDGLSALAAAAPPIAPDALPITVTR